MKKRHVLVRKIKDVNYDGWQQKNIGRDDTGEFESKLHSEAVVEVGITIVMMPDALVNTLVHLQTLRTAYQSAHWCSSSESFYGDHLLFERLYSSTNEEIDHVAEKILGLTGDETLLNPAKLTIASANLFKTLFRQGDSASSLLMAEKAFIKHVEMTLTSLGDAKKLSSGVENMLQDLVDKHEKNVYLLSRRVGAEAIRLCIKTV